MIFFNGYSGVYVWDPTYQTFDDYIQFASLNGSPSFADGAFTADLSYSGSSLSLGKEYVVLGHKASNIEDEIIVSIMGSNGWKGQRDFAIAYIKEDPTYELPTNLTASYGSTLSDVKLPGGFDWEGDASAVTFDNIGSSSHLASYTPEDTVLYNVVSGIPLTITVIPANLASVQASFIDDQEFAGVPVEPDVELTLGDYALVQGVDYTLQYLSNDDVGSASVIVCGIGRFMGQIEIPFNIVDNSVEPDDPSNPVKSDIVAAFDSRHGTVVLPEGPVAAGSDVTVTATPLSGYKAATVVVTDEYGSEIEVAANGDSTWTFTMPGSDVVVSVEFVLIENAPNTPSEPSNPSNPSTPTPPVDREVALGFDAALGDVSVSPESAKAGETVTVTAVPLPGYEVGSVTVTDASGKAVGVAEADGGKWAFEMPDGDVDVAVEFAPTPWENPFSDVSEDDWFYHQVRRANLLGLMKGYDGTDLFGPDDGLMREQAATVMWNLMGAGDVSRPGAPQADVGQSQWYAPYVNWAVDSKVMDGYDTGSFGVGDPLTREQFAAVVAKAVGADVDSADQAALGAFPDADGVSGWARATMAWAVENGLVNGVETEDGARELQAGRTLTRAEMAAMMMNAIDKGVLKLSE